MKWLIPITAFLIIILVFFTNTVDIPSKNIYKDSKNFNIVNNSFSPYIQVITKNDAVIDGNDKEFTNNKWGTITDIKSIDKKTGKVFNIENQKFELPLLDINKVSITSAFGKRISPLTNKEESHGGYDLAAPVNTKIHSIGNGTVSKNYISNTFGNCIQVVYTLEGQQQFEIVYAHMIKQSTIPVGTQVKTGDVIGFVGSTGDSTGNHLHFQMQKVGDYATLFDAFREIYGIDTEKVNNISAQTGYKNRSGLD